MTILLRQKPLPQVVRQIVQRDNGAWFDTEDMSTMFQDAAGTTPVTAVEQPVGKMLDKSGNGYHATQPITASRPTLSARKNILLATEALATQSVTTLAATYTLSFTGTGSVTLSGTSTGTLTGTGTDRVSLTFTPTAGTLTLTVSGSVAKAQLGLGSVVTSYQRVTTATDYDVSAHYYYLRFDGVDDYLNLPYMGLYAGGRASVVAGVGVTSAGGDIINEANSSNAVPVYRLMRQFSATIKGLIYRTNGNVTTTIDTLSSPSSDLPRIVSSIDTGSKFSLLDNGGVAVDAIYARGTTTLSNTTIGAMIRTTTTDFVAMNLYGLIITKSALTDSQRIACERHLSRKSGVQL